MKNTILTKSLFNTYVDCVRNMKTLSMKKYQIMFIHYTKCVISEDKDLDTIRDKIIAQQKKVEAELND